MWPDHFHFDQIDQLACLCLWFQLLVVPLYARIRYGRRPLALVISTGPEAVLRWTYFLTSLALPHIYWANFVVGGPSYDIVTPLRFAGLVMLIVAVVVYTRARTDLGAMWSTTLGLYSDHTLVTSGVYASVRHPAYAAYIVQQVALALIVPNALVVLVPLVAVCAWVHVATRIEDDILKRNTGQMCAIYHRRVAYKLIPYFV